MPDPSPVLVAHRTYHDDRRFATLRIGVGWNPGVGDEVVWSWKDPAEERWRVVEIVDPDTGTHFGPTVVGERVS